MFHEPITGEERTRLIEEILLYRAKGYSLRRTALKVGVSKSEVANLEKEALTIAIERIKGQAEYLRALEVERCDELYDVLSDLVAKSKDNGDTESADLEVIDRILKIAARKAKLLGLDAPQKLDLKLYDQLSEEELDERIRSFEAKLLGETGVSLPEEYSGRA